jgi:hypothetical protein
MKKINHLTAVLILIVVIASSFAFGAKAQAQLTVPPTNSGCTEAPNTGQYCLLEPLPLGNNTVYDKYDPTTTSAANYINIIIKVFISVIGVLGVIMIILGGVQYLSTDAISKKEGGREMISNSVFGLLLALASWVLLNTINPQLLTVTIDPPKGTAVTVSSTDAIPTETTSTKTTLNGQQVTISSHCTSGSVEIAAADGVNLTDGSPWGTVPALKASDDDIRSRLSAAGVGINHPVNCATVGQTGCTSVYKLGDIAINGLTNLHSVVCGSSTSCKLTVTGGTECWLHSSHQILSGRVDLAVSPELEAYVKKVPKVCIGWIKSESSDGCGAGQAGQYIVGSTVFIRESDHYHIQQW